MFRKLLDQGQAGDNIGALLRGIDKKDIQRGQVLAKPGSIKPHTKFTANVYVLTKDEGGRHTPFFPGYRPQFYIRTTDVTGSIKFDGEMVMPGDNVVMEVELIQRRRQNSWCRRCRQNPRIVYINKLIKTRKVKFSGFLMLFNNLIWFFK